MHKHKKNILLISPEPWNHIFVSKHNYARQLAQAGYKVCFLGPPSSNWRVEHIDKNLCVVHYQGFPKGFRFLPKSIRKKILRKLALKIEAFSKFGFEIVWSFDNSVFFDFDAWPEETIKISHIVDLNQDFQTAKAASSADICLATTTQIVKRLKKYNTNTHKILHGLNEGALHTDKIMTLPGKNDLKATYLGNLAMQYLDWDILLDAVSEHKNIDFVFIGPNADDFDLQNNSTALSKKKLIALENTHLIGKINSQEIQAYLASSDILLLAYQESHHDDQANPHKVMEYLASGKPIVATYTGEYLKQRDIIHMSNQNKDWLNILMEVKNNLSWYNSQTLQEKRKGFALKHTYKNQILKIEEIIENLGK